MISQKSLCTFVDILSHIKEKVSLNKSIFSLSSKKWATLKTPITRRLVILSQLFCKPELYMFLPDLLQSGKLHIHLL